MSKIDAQSLRGGTVLSLAKRVATFSNKIWKELSANGLIQTARGSAAKESKTHRG
jgi:hypothetical protein